MVTILVKEQNSEIYGGANRNHGRCRTAHLCKDCFQKADEAFQRLPSL
jgi:hypothetical protein